MCLFYTVVRALPIEAARLELLKALTSACLQPIFTKPRKLPHSNNLI